MGDEGWLLITAIAIVGLVLLVMGIALFIHCLAVAINIFAWAADYGFVGIALYIILWVIATPVMLIICIVGGVLHWITHRGSYGDNYTAEHKADNKRTPPSPNDPEYMSWANRTGRFADPAERER